MKGKQILGVDPAFRTGCKLAVVNPFGTFIAKVLFILILQYQKLRQPKRAGKDDK